MNNQFKNPLLIVSLLPPLLVGIISGIATAANTKVVYSSIIKPPLSPPAFVFPIVWTILYIMMGLASYLVISSPARKEEKIQAMLLFYLQLLLNFLWSIVFFNKEQFGLAFAIIALLWFLIFLTSLAFYRINKKAGNLMLPYLLWVGFAIYLNLSILVLN